MTRQHAGVWQLLRAVLTIPRRYVPTCEPVCMTAEERAHWHALVESAQRIDHYDEQESAA